MEQILPALGKGFFLIANGNLSDPHFSRTVVLICDHSEKGSYGLVVNQRAGVPLSKTNSSALYVGGPCERDRVQVLHRLSSLELGGAEICQGVAIGGDFTKILKTFGSAEVSSSRARFYSGYSGWGAGQLSEEMQRKSWILCPATAKWIFETPVESLWADLLRSMGGYFVFLADMPGDLSVN